MEENENKSVIDELYYRVFGKHQSKEGQALERLSAIAFKLLHKERKVMVDQQVRAPYSQTVYQVDGIEYDGTHKTMIEAKDYTVRGDKVGRADLQKLEGALTDLEIAEGRFVSATDYTNRAKPYAESTKSNPMQYPIDLYHVRPSNEEDEKGRIKTIQVTIRTCGLDFEKGKYKPIINKNTLEKIKDKIPQNGQKVTMDLHHFYAGNGEIIETLENITHQLCDKIPLNAKRGFELVGRWDFHHPTYIKVPQFDMLHIDAIEYKIPTYQDECVFTINQEGSPVLLIKSDDGKINKLLTDEQLRKCEVKDGEVKG